MNEGYWIGRAAADDREISELQGALYAAREHSAGMVDAYNDVVVKYNGLVEQYKALAAQRDQLLEERNSLSEAKRVAEEKHDSLLAKYTDLSAREFLKKIKASALGVQRYWLCQALMKITMKHDVFKEIEGAIRWAADSAVAHYHIDRATADNFIEVEMKDLRGDLKRLEDLAANGWVRPKPVLPPYEPLF